MKRKTKNIVSTIAGCIYASLYMPGVPVMAKGVKEITDGIQTIKDIVLACATGLGIIILVLGLIDFGTSYSAHDTTQQSIATKKVVGGLIIIAVPAILKALGVA